MRLSTLFLLLAATTSLPFLGACSGSPDATSAAASSDAITSWSASYPALADSRVPASHKTVVTALGAFGDATLPHEAKTLRKQIGEYRDYIDLFAFAYDKHGAGDPWSDLRKDLDTGYETVGSFKDLFDAQGLTLAVRDPATGAWGPGVKPSDVTYPDKSEVTKRRKKVLEWRSGFLSHAADYAAYVAHADTEKMHAHGDVQSQFFWAGAGVEPTLDASGLENLSALTRALVPVAAHDLDDIKGLDDVLKLDDHETFHDLRKRVRAIVKVLGYYPELLEPDGEAPLATVSELVDRYGALNDEISAYGLMKSGSDKKKLGKKLDDEWKDLRKWQKDQDVAGQLDTLRKRVRKRG